MSPGIAITGHPAARPKSKIGCTEIPLESVQISLGVLPIAIGYGVDPIHLGIIFLANMQIGYFTPPVGMNLYIASYRFKKPVIQLFRATLPFFVILLMAVLVITYWPALSLALPSRS